MLGCAFVSASACDDVIEENALSGGGKTPEPEVPDEVRAACARLCELTNTLNCAGGMVDCNT